jgi:DNA-binding response OmpR family regulator
LVTIGRQIRAGDDLVDVHMGRLPRKVDASSDPPMISNVRGVGFIHLAFGSA